MITKIFVFEVDGVRVSAPRIYVEEPTKQRVLEDMKNWFFENHHMWFAVKEDGKETILEDWFNE